MPSLNIQEKSMKAKLVVLSLSIALSGCSTIHSTVLPQADGKYVAIATHNEERVALKTVMTDAKTTCKKAGHKDFYSTSQKSEYVGPKMTDGSETGVSGFALKVAEAAAKHNNKENYRVEISFACKG
jgi:uncharacterized protein YceK